MGSKCAPKGSVNSVRSVREKTPQRLAWVLSHSEGAFYFSQIYTEEQNITANEDTNKKIKSSLHPAYRGISVITPLPFGEGKGEGPLSF